MSDELLAMLSALDQQVDVREHYMRAPFGYPGSKARSIKEIVPRLPYRLGYGEPFGGTGCILLSRNESKLEVYNDRYGGVVAFYRCIKDKEKLQAMVDWLELTIHAREEFCWCRDSWRNCLDDVERAARWYYMFTNSFSQQGRNFGRNTATRAQNGQKLHNNLELFWPLHYRMYNVQVENQDWRACLKDYDNKDFVWYLDPPYYKTTGGKYECDMTPADHMELLERIQYLNGFVAISSYENELYEKYKWDEKYTWIVPVGTLGMAFQETNNFAGFEDTLKRQHALEVLYIKRN